jgi:hypothetical protein
MQQLTAAYLRQGASPCLYGSAGFLHTRWQPQLTSHQLYYPYLAAAAPAVPCCPRVLLPSCCCSYIYSYPDLVRRHTLPSGTERAYSAACFSPDGTRLAAVGSAPDYLLTLWDWEAGGFAAVCGSSVFWGMVPQFGTLGTVLGWMDAYLMAVMQHVLSLCLGAPCLNVNVLCCAMLHCTAVLCRCHAAALQGLQPGGVCARVLPPQPWCPRQLRHGTHTLLEDGIHIYRTQAAGGGWGWDVMLQLLLCCICTH